MKVVLLAGGFGSRISEESQFKPKPMIEIGGMPILWHIMKEYAYYGHTKDTRGHKGQVSVPNSLVSCQGKAASNRAQEFIMS